LGTGKEKEPGGRKLAREFSQWGNSRKRNFPNGVQMAGVIGSYQEEEAKRENPTPRRGALAVAKENYLGRTALRTEMRRVNKGLNRDQKKQKELNGD